VTDHAQTMTPYSANPFVYVFSALAIGAVFLYFGFAVIDRTGLEVHTSVATVTGKVFSASGKAYYTTIAGGRAWVQSQDTPETYAVTLNLGGEPTVGLVSKEMFDALKTNDIVHVKVRRTRITRRLEVIDLTK